MAKAKDFDTALPWQGKPTRKGTASNWALDQGSIQRLELEFVVFGGKDDTTGGSSAWEKSD